VYRSCPEQPEIRAALRTGSPRPGTGSRTARCADCGGELGERAYCLPRRRGQAILCPDCLEELFFAMSLGEKAELLGAVPVYSL